MAVDSKSSDPLDLDLPEGLEEDIEDDWESAFRAEDFMLPLDEEEENEAAAETDGEMDLASLLQSDETQAKDLTSNAPVAERTVTEPELPGKFFSPETLISLPSLAKIWFSGRPFYQKLLLPTAVIALTLFITAVFFFKNTTEQLSKQEEDSVVIEETASNEAAVPAEVSAVDEKKEEPLSVQPVKIRKKWNLPAFFIAAEDQETQEKIVIKIDISLVLLLDPGQSIPEEKTSFIRDAIYQFYINRPVAELRTYSLARGEMIRKLNAWLSKEWPDSPITSVIFNSFQAIS